MTNYVWGTDFSRRRNVDPSVLLVTELEILVAQTRLLEVYLKQAQASAELETNRITESYKAELAALRSELTERNNALEQYRDTLREADSRLQAQLQALQIQCQEQQSALECRQNELQAARSELASLRAWAVQLEESNRDKDAAAGAAERRRDELEAILAGVRAELAERVLELQDHQSRSRELEERLSFELQQLKSQLAATEAQSGAHEAELAATHDEIARLSQRIGEVEQERNQVEQAARESDRLRAELEAQLAAWQKAVELKDQALTERQLALAEIERAAQTDLSALQAELADKQQRVETLESGLDTALARAADLETRAARADRAQQESAAAHQESEWIRHKLESDIAGLRAELAAKEETLASQAAASTALEQSLQQRHQQILRELEQARALADVRERDAQRTSGDVALLRDRVAELEGNAAAHVSAVAAAEAARQSAENERTALQDSLAEIERALSRQEQAFRSRENELIGELAALRARLSAKEAEMDGQSAELSQARSEVAALSDEKSRLELLQRQTERLLSAQAEQIRHQVRAELADLESRLREKDQLLQVAEQKSTHGEAYFSSKISELQLQLAEKQLRLQSGQAELESLKSHVAVLSERLGELESAKQGIEAAADEAAAGLHAEYEAKLSRLREELTQAHLNLEEQITAANGVEENQAAQILELQNQLTVARQDHARLLEAGRRETAALQERLAEIEACRQREKDTAAAEAEEIRKSLQGEVAMLQREVQQKDWAIAQRQAALENLAHCHKEQTQKLEARLAEAQRSAENRSGDFEKAETEAGSLRGRIAQLETALEHAQATAAYQLSQLQREYDQRLAALQTDLEQRSHELEARARSLDESESAAKLELHQLNIEVQEKRALLENRNEELLLVKAEMDLLQERVLQLEAEAERKEHAAASEREQMQNEFQARIALLQAEVSQKQWALDERQATVYGVEHRLGQQIQDLQAELAHKEEALNTHAAEFSIEPPELSDAQKERLEQVDKMAAAVIDADASFPASANRRWRSHLGWKRRWRS